MSTTPRVQAMEMADYASLLRRRWWVMVVGAALGVAVAALAVVTLPDVYTGKATVLVTPEDPESRNTEINLDTESGRVRGVEVVKRAQAILGTSEGFETLIERVTVSAPRDSSLLAISYTAADPTRARDGANAFANAYLAHRKARAESRLKRQVNSLQSQVDKLKERLERAPKDDLDERNLINGELQAYSSRLADVRIDAADVSVGEMLTLAAMPKQSSFPDPMMFLPAGLFGGILLGAAIALMVDRADNRVRAASDVRRVLGAPILLNLPRSRKTAALGIQSARSRIGQRFHELSHAITARLGDGPGNQVILVTGASEGMGSNIVAVNIAAALARTGSDVMLVNADLRSEVSSRLLGVAEQQGLSEVLLGTSTLSEVETRAAMPPSLRVLSRGHETELVVDMLQGERMSRLVDSLRDRSRYVVIEAPSTSAGADAQALAQLADLVLMVVEVPKTRFTDIRDGLRQLDQVGAELPGAVVIPSQSDEGLAGAVPPSVMTYEGNEPGGKKAGKRGKPGKRDRELIEDIVERGAVGSDEDGLSTATFPAVRNGDLSIIKDHVKR
ncbi:capsular exopolysaccharide family [Sinosporangium album]|uniref:Capsular exopolysaccharide family n=1 Tax=Sinosporangium album TaxID=504805 RepID=A0A1G7UFM5_9ACTN|nr:tyrosine-protein kinase family protein [Sinosporangium album]SDG45570.1 capsular exopolysaccharide family [Sinosporangium album]